MPAAPELPDRLDAVLTVVHLLYTTGHTSPGGGHLVRADLVDRAIGLARMLSLLMPDESEVRGLLALLLLTDARRATRCAPDGRLLLLEEQDRSQWDRPAIAEGTALVRAALRGGRPGRFALQAAIAALHAQAPSYARPTGRRSWALRPARAGLGLARGRAQPGRRAGHGRRARGWPGAIGDLERDGRLAGYRYLPAAKADLLRRLGRRGRGRTGLPGRPGTDRQPAERDFLTRRLAEVTGNHAGP